MKPALVVFTKLPIRGRVKTRLTPLVSPRAAAELHRCFLLDTLATASRIKARTVVAYSPRGAADLLKEFFHGWSIPQQGGSLGERMSSAFQEVFHRGFSPGVMIGSDIPTLPPGFLREAFKALREKDLVLGPAVDGGYYLIGMHRLHPGVFRDISWGTPGVLRQTLERIRELGLRFSCLPVWYDVDAPRDLVFLKAHVEALRACNQEYPMNTHRFLRKLGL